MHTCGTEQRLFVSAHIGKIYQFSSGQLTTVAIVYLKKEKWVKFTTVQRCDSRTKSYPFILAQKCSVGAYGHEQEHKVRKYINSERKKKYVKTHKVKVSAEQSNN